MKKDFITVTPDNGNGDATVTVAASEKPIRKCSFFYDNNSRWWDK